MENQPDNRLVTVRGYGTYNDIEKHDEEQYDEEDYKHGGNIEITFVKGGKEVHDCQQIEVYGDDLVMAIKNAMNT